MEEGGSEEGQEDQVEDRSFEDCLESYSELLISLLTLYHL